MIKDPNCKNKTWRMTDLDNIVLDEIKKLYLEPEYIDTIKSRESQRKTPANKVEILKKKSEKPKNRYQGFLTYTV